MSTPQAAPASAPTRSATTTPATFRTFAAPPLPPPQEPSPAEALDAALPPPHIFDILPALHELLSRLLAPGAAPSTTLAANGDPATASSASASAAQTQTQMQIDEQPLTQPDAASTTTPATTGASQSQPAASQPLLQANGAAAAMHSQNQTQTPTAQYTTLQPTYPNQAPLSIQHLAAEVSVIRNMIRRAREAVSGLPDVDRRVEQQQEEIAYWTGEVARLRGVLAGLKAQGEAEAG